MNPSIKEALTASIEQYARLATANGTDFLPALIAVFELNVNFMQKVTAFDQVFDDFPAFDELREVYFDLLMLNFFTSDAAKLEEDYLESDEWAKIEEDTLDRGTEMLNLFLYVNECKDENIVPSLDDFLKEFLLVEEDEFQDEFDIYEDLISNQQLADSSVEDICNNAALMTLTEEMEDLFVPVMSFFNQPDFDKSTIADLERFSNNSDFDVAVYALIANFNKI